MKAEYINPFIKASKEILTQMTQLNFQVGKPTLKTSPYSANNIVILIGITGDIKGQAMLSFDESMALKVVSKMMGGMEIKDLDDIGKSALSELGNMILGNSATLLFNIGVEIDITPPTLMTGENLSVSGNQMQVISVPLDSDGEKIDLSIFIKE
ncbi:chemotaxis protein CheX [Paramaledivibacter caminithermalis]|uniref:Chemotaxis protein CheX n=1 Tax=Paramaledivibacter caminithermalis (strain DSM 15212 / CIP 107654 / DViRD3) TaxID=1121301 RepID=A0A1M6MK41_PARC5|nr:chemotaxis protein CheX [Paramaledivibacter caminithermalis]SHJ83859.1 chemotaxis protein CheX [Paramaledivibacter caminithermalis DSM 15212]